MPLWVAVFLLQVDAGLEALSDALRSGFDQYKVPATHVWRHLLTLVESGSSSGGWRPLGAMRVVRRHMPTPRCSAGCQQSSLRSLANSVLCCRLQVVREDKNLDQLRSDPRFTKLIDEYDEPVFNSGALK